MMIVLFLFIGILFFWLFDLMIDWIDEF